MNISREEYDKLTMFQIRVYTKAIEEKLILEKTLDYKVLETLEYNKNHKTPKKLWE